ncbi:twin-arginine translocase TatA/TatE family subunit [Demequina iriomotensis]|uniref:twin-arginine translocase TatA/TatE family subunit n=1 Tax=Demequina iriomotensis TaxID=1536641 RepID=UPI000783406C|nr:twin-arginine translocase TatA/TatE family subunit [Demequina iriomotensis]
MRYQEILIILLIVLLLFGAPKLPQLARSLGQSMRILRDETKTDSQETGGETESKPAATPADDPRDSEK